MSSTRPSRSSPDLLVIGAGAVGLWTAWKAVQAGMSVTVLDKAHVGAGASGGVLGALMPHRPSQWTASKQFQLEALSALAGEIAQVEAASGLSCGYRRCGRLMPIDSERRLQEHQGWQVATGKNWTGVNARWDILDQLPGHWRGLMQDAFAYDFDTLSARVDPRALLASLAAAVRGKGGVIIEGEAVSNPSSLMAARVVIAAGHESFALAGEPVSGWGVKGQAVLLKPVRAMPDDLPILYRGGTYVIYHESGLVAAGSTSERDFADALPDQETIATLAANAIDLCPALEGAELVESWAGIRPRAAGRQPVVGALAHDPRLIMATGGFKITLGIAHCMADAVVAVARGEAPEVPPGFAPGGA